MASSINADNGVSSGSAGLKSTADSSGVLALQTNGTTAISIDASQAVSFTNQPTYSGGTANGVAYLNGSKVLTTGSALVFDGTNLGVGTSSPANKLDVSGTVRSTTQTAPSSGAGMELFYDSSGNVGYLLSYNRSTSAYKQINFGASLYNFGIAGSTVMTLDSSGNLGLGVTPSAWNTTTAVTALQLPNGSLMTYSNAYGFSNLYLSANAYLNSSGNWIYTKTNSASLYQQTDRQHAWLYANSGTAGTAITFTQAMTLDASGNLLVGTTTQTGTFNVTYTGTTQPTSYFYASNASFTNAVVRASMAGTSSSAQLFLGQNSNTTAVFYVQGNGTINSTSTSITGISDIRFKENIRDLDDGLNVVMALKPRKFDWKEGKGANIKNARGFIAQEFEQVLPDLIGEWLEESPEGEEPYKSVSPDLIPTLVKAIQEQQALITQLQADVAALKGASA